jgi:hypothetical protein
MASYGRGYHTYTSVNELSVALEKYLDEAFDATINIMYAELQSMFYHGIYDVPESEKYDRTYETSTMLRMREVENGKVQFYFTKQGIEIDNPYHNQLEGLSGVDFIRLITFDENGDISYGNNNHYGAHSDVIGEMQDYIKNNFKKIYQEQCKRLGLSLQ